MSTEVVSALIAAIVSVLGTIVTLTISLRTTRIDNDRLLYERQRLEHELKIGREKLQVERTRLEHELHFESERLANEGQRLKFELQRNEDTITK